MYSLRVKPGVLKYEKTVYFTNPKCGHSIEFKHSVPFKCPVDGCKDVPPMVQRLLDEHAVAARVKYFAEGKL